MSFKEYINNDIVYHGTSVEGARDIEENGIDMDKSTKGYFGTGFYVTPDKELARSNYASFSDDEGGVVLEFKIIKKGRVLDLRNEGDWIKWRDSGLDRLKGRDGFDKIAVKAGIDGLYDNSFGGYVIYNPGVLEYRGRV